MTRHAVLDNVTHRDLRVSTAAGARFGDAVMAAITFPAEFRNVQAHYPIVFQRAQDGGFLPLALFGLHEGENEYLVDDCWDAPYVPLSLRRQPFLIGFDATREPVVHVDLDHPRANAADGEPVFLPHGGIGPVLQEATEILHALHDGVRATPAFVDALVTHRLLEPFALDLTHPDGTVERWSGFHTIHEERLQALDGAALGALNAAGHLLPIYLVVASMSRLRDVVDRAQRRQAATPAPACVN